MDRLSSLFSLFLIEKKRKRSIKAKKQKNLTSVEKHPKRGKTTPSRGRLLLQNQQLSTKSRAKTWVFCNACPSPVRKWPWACLRTLYRHTASRRGKRPRPRNDPCKGPFSSKRLLGMEQARLAAKGMGKTHQAEAKHTRTPSRAQARHAAIGTDYAAPGFHGHRRSRRPHYSQGGAGETQ